MKQFYLAFLITLSTLVSYAQLTPPEELQSYYSAVDFSKTGLELKTELSNLTISKHSKALTYTEVWSALKVTDEDPDNANNVLLVYGYDDTDNNYSTDRSRNKNTNGGNTGDWNREHIYPKSLGTPNLGTEGPGADAQMLRPSDIDRNADRNNLKYAKGSGHSAFSNNGWYPGDEWKGDCARIIMYMYLRYGEQCLPSNVGFGTSEFTPDDMIDLFLEWNVEDPVSSFEMQRNTYHDNTSNTYAQGNRNPFIDNPYLATAIWGGPVAENTWGSFGTNDTEAPTTPTNLVASNIESTSFTLDWTASTDNVAVASYSINFNGTFYSFAYSNTITIKGLIPETTYTVSVYATDTSGNISEESESITVTTTEASNIEYCISESFTNLTSTQGYYDSQYVDRNWVGDNGLTWKATEARIDETLNNSKVITIRNGELIAPTTTGGIGQLTVTTRQIYSGDSGTFDVYVNDDKVGEIPYSQDITTTTLDNINVGGIVSVKFTNNSIPDSRAMFDDVSWTCYETLYIEDDTLSKVKIYPNPAKNNLVYISTTKDIDVTIYNILGKVILKQHLTAHSKTINVSQLNQGVYVMKLSSDSGSITKKLIKQ
ncbi:endonuclease [Formosa sp. S-31]|uniref:endonuclease n=1 Tax=Formosa sp. S-31 TaxID=2790949 RepID=UPI003EBAB062